MDFPSIFGESPTDGIPHRPSLAEPSDRGASALRRRDAAVAELLRSISEGLAGAASQAYTRDWVHYLVWVYITYDVCNLCVYIYI